MVGVVSPVKAFAHAKRRLAGVLADGARAELARSMAETVVRAAAPLPVTIVCDDDVVRSWALGLGVDVVWTPGLGLNGAVEAGVAHLATLGHDLAVVAHADLPLARELAWVADFDGVTLVPDRHLDGTNVAAVPTSAGFRFAYGPASFRHHQAEAARLDLPVRVVEDQRLGWDVDVPDDLRFPDLDAQPCGS